MESPNTRALAGRWQELGAGGPVLVRALRSFTSNAAPFRAEAEKLEAGTREGEER
jgi:hypothetical protein